jgi:signal peptidase I
MTRNRFATIRRELVTVAVAAAVVATARTSLADHYIVPSGSMLPTVEIDDHVLVDKIAYGVHVPLLDRYAVHLGEPARGDVVVLQSPEDGRTLLKRVIAVPGDRVCVSDGTVTIDGREMPIRDRDGGVVEELGRHEHRVSLAYGGGPDYGPLVVPDGEYLVMGDNRGNSRDGRSFGLVKEDAIMGRVEGVFLRHGAPTWVQMK